MNVFVNNNKFVLFEAMVAAVTKRMKNDNFFFFFLLCEKKYISLHFITYYNLKAACCQTSTLNLIARFPYLMLSFCQNKETLSVRSDCICI